jgi:hypothetical protein
MELHRSVSPSGLSCLLSYCQGLSMPVSKPAVAVTKQAMLAIRAMRERRALACASASRSVLRVETDVCDYGVSRIIISRGCFANHAASYEIAK